MTGYTYRVSIINLEGKEYRVGYGKHCRDCVQCYSESTTGKRTVNICKLFDKKICSRDKRLQECIDLETRVEQENIK